MIWFPFKPPLLRHDKQVGGWNKFPSVCADRLHGVQSLLAAATFVSTQPSPEGRQGSDTC